MRASMRSLFFAAAILCVTAGNVLAAPAAPAEVPVYAVLSLIGDRLDIVIRQFQTGTRVDSNRHEPLAITNAVFDDAAVRAAGNAVRQTIPKAEIAALNTRSQVLFDKQATLFAVSDSTMAVPEPIKVALREQGATKLVLVAKHRDDASFRFAEGSYDGAGKLEGLGFYLDGTWRTHSVDRDTGATSNPGKGFIAPFAFMEVTLVDIPSFHVLGRKKIAAYFMAGSGRAEQDIGEPWSALSSADKVRLVNKLIEREVAAAVTGLVAGAATSN